MTKVLVIRFRRVGDAVLTSSICTTLKQSIPDAEIHYVLNDTIAPLFEHHPDIDKLITFTHEETHSLFPYLQKIKRIMKEEKYDIIIDTRTTANTMYFPLLSMRTKYRIGKKKKYALAYNHRVSNFYRGDMDIVQLLLKLLTPLEKDFNIQRNPHFRLRCTEEEIVASKHKMASHGIDVNKPIIVCAITSRLEHKIWDKSKMKVVLLKILSKYPDIQLIFNYGGETEKEAARQLFEEMNSDPRIFIGMEAQSLRELAALLANSTFFFGNEGGPRHISQAFDIPSFAIFPPHTPKGEWLPNMSDRFQGIEVKDIDPIIALDENISYEDKFNLISVDEVWKKLEPMLEKNIRF